MSWFTDALGYAGDALDKPGRAVRGLLAGRGDEALAAVPFSDSLGLTDESRAVTGKDLLRQYVGSTGSETGDAILGFGADIALDPTTYFGGAIGRLGGKALGRGLEAAAKARGPGYGTAAAGLADQAAAVVQRGSDVPLDRILDHIRNAGDLAPGVLREVPEGSRLLGAGAEGVAYRTPAGDVVRFGMVPKEMPGRPLAEGVLAPTRTVDFPVAGSDLLYRSERLPFAEGASTGLTPVGMPRTATVSPDVAKGLAADLGRVGIDFHDAHVGNVGVHRGRPVVIDPGAIDALDSFRGGFAPITASADPGPLTRRLLDLLGGQPALRRSLDAGLAAPRYERNLGLAGLLAGSSLGGT